MNEKEYAVYTAKEQAATAVNMLYSAINASAEAGRSWYNYTKDMVPEPKYNLIVNDLNNGLPNKFELLTAIYGGKFKTIVRLTDNIEVLFNEYDYDDYRYLLYLQEHFGECITELASLLFKEDY